MQNVLDESGITKGQYDDALEVMDNRVSIVYKRKLNEGYISPYNTVLLSLVKSNMNLQFVTGIYGMILYLTKYLTKVENRMSELMRKVSKEAANQDIRAKLRKIGNVFLIKSFCITFWPWFSKWMCSVDSGNIINIHRLHLVRML